MDHPDEPKRKKLTKDERHAALILEMKRGDGKPIVTREEARHMTPLEIIKTFADRTHVEHIVPFATTQDDHPANIQFLTPDDHAPKTKRDVTQIAKTKRLAKEHAAFRSRMLANTEDTSCVETAEIVKKNKAWPSQKLKSRGFEKKPKKERFIPPSR